jgi:hypothetical protein
MATYVAPPVPLNPGESYVVGSLRQVSVVASRASSTASAPVAKASTPLATPKAPRERKEALPNGLVLVQFTQDGCHPCEQDQQKARQAGVPMEMLSFSDTEDAFKIANLCRQLKPEVTGTPFYVLHKNGVVYRWKAGQMSDFTSAIRTAQNYAPDSTRLAELESPKAEKTAVAPDKLDRIETALLELIEETKASRKETHLAIETLTAARSR